MHIKISQFFDSLKAQPQALQNGDFSVHTPITGEEIAHINLHNVSDVDGVVAQAKTAFQSWRLVPTPVRGRLIGILGEVLREHKEALSELVTLECGKIISEGRGEVQEMIDICEFAVGLSRQIGGTLFPSELDGHIMQERWHPKGVVGIISAFNFPVAVWAWNFALSIVCGNANIWKPSEKTPIVAEACQVLFDIAAKRFTDETGVNVPEGLSIVLQGKGDVGAAMVAHKDVALVSATGSCAMGDKVQGEVSKTLGRECLLELGGNNAVIITPNADLTLAVESTLFGAIGTAGQRCTTTRRLLIHKSIFDDVYEVFKNAYASISDDIIGNPLDGDTLIGPLIDEQSYAQFKQSVKDAAAQGGEVTGGVRVLQDNFGDEAFYVRPALVKMEKQTGVVETETFAPILYVMPYDTLEDAIAINNSVEQGLSSAILTNDLTEAEQFLRDSDCGIANVNNGTSGAEIGGAFGGNKSTGGGRESGSDSWKQYATRSTNRINTTPGPMQLAQGVKFPLKIDRAAIKKVQQ